MGGGAVPNSPTRDCSGKARYIANIMKEKEADFICLQEVGVYEESTPPELSFVFEEVLQANVYSHGPPRGSPGGSKRGVAIVLSNEWTVTNVQMDGTGRAMAVSIKKGSFETIIVSVLMPTNLDSKRPDNAGMEEWLMAECILELVDEWTRPFECFFIQGDFNETVDPILDRSRPKSARRSRGHQTAPCGYIPLVSRFIEGEGPHGSSARVDLCRHLFPGVPHYTRTGNTRAGASHSRIDYVIVPATLTADKRLTWDYDRILDGQSDHFVLSFTLTTTSSSVLPPSVGRTRPDPWTPKHPDISDTDLDKVRDCQNRCELVASRFLADWGANDNIPSQGRRNHLIETLRSGWRKAARGVFGSRRVTRNAGKSVCRNLQEVQDIRSALRRASVSMGLARSRANSLDFHGEEVSKAIAGLRYLGICPEGLKRGDQVNWFAWADTQGPIISALGRQANVLWNQDECGENAHTLKDRLFSDPKKRGQFVSRFLKNARSAKLDCATLPDGTVSWDKDQYLPIVRDLVAKPMSTFVPLPPPVLPGYEAELRARM